MTEAQAIDPCLQESSNSPWIKRFANPRVFLFLFCAVGILQGAYFTYFIGILSTLERRYAFDSSITGIILIADNISPALFGIFVGYYSKYAHRPRLVTGGMIIVIFSCLLSCLPYFMYGPGINSSDLIMQSRNETNLCMNNDGNEYNCESQEMTETSITVTILFIANFLNGFGSMAYYTVGICYLDDNVRKKESPLYLGAMFALRIVGPTLGFMLSSFSLTYYENPLDDPDFSNDDSRWIGAWWIGFLILAFILSIFSIPIAFFPRNMDEALLLQLQPVRQSIASRVKLSDLLSSVKKLIHNHILIFHTLSITFQINGIFGYYVFMPKYMESQYQQTASSASFFSGTKSMITTIIGVFLGGAVIKKFKPKPRYLTGYMLFVGIFATAGLVTSLFLGCPQLNISGINDSNTMKFEPQKTCNADCNCSMKIFNPVCDLQGTTHFSPCFAGCNAYNSTSKKFSGCSCVKTGIINATTEVKHGFCSSFCNMFLPYFIVLSASKIFASTSRVGNVLVTLRCVDEEDKTLALGAVEFFVSIFATIPYPIIYGHVIDSTCIIWEERCQKRGSCQLYDRDKFRWYLHSLSITFLLLGTLCDIVVFRLSQKLKYFYESPLKGDNDDIQLENRAT